MTGKFDVTKCFADDSVNKQKGKFWENFHNLDIEKWKEDKRKIYYDNKYCDKDALPDPDATSKSLYDIHQTLWNLQSEKFNISEVIPNPKKDCELIIKEKDIHLGSDSIMSIYWHWAGNKVPFSTMQKLIEKIGSSIQERKEYNELKKEMKEKGCDTEKYLPNQLKNFIYLYLKKANTIGGFVVFPKHDKNINGRRGISAKIRDRFDLTLECIKRGYEKIFDENDLNNPLADVLKADQEFFKMFESFDNYINFFCLNSWIEDGHVLSLIDNQHLDNWDFNNGEPLPTKDNWWTFYKNIMSRLDARNKAIQDLFPEENK